MCFFVFFFCVVCVVGVVDGVVDVVCVCVVCIVGVVVEERCCSALQGVKDKVDPRIFHVMS